MLKCSQDILGYNQFVSNKWKILQVDGCRGFVLKEKFKLIILALKEWHMTHTDNLPGQIDSLKQHLSVLDCKGEDEVLSEAEIEKMHGIISDIHSLSRINTSICWQQSMLLWLREGDANSEYFHSVLVNRWRRNAIYLIMVDGVLVEGVNPIREPVVSLFASPLKACVVWKGHVRIIFSSRLSFLEDGSLIKSFSLKEVKVVVWDFDSYKSLGPDVINFGFIKDFCLNLKDYIMRFISKFHRNSKLTKGINNNFIALTPKVDSRQKLNV